MGSQIADLRHGLRVLKRTPQLSALAIVTIAIGVGITTHTFSIVYSTVLRGLPVPADHELVDVHVNNPARSVSQGSLSFPDYLAVANQVRAFERVAGYTRGTVNLAGQDAPPERYAGASVSSSLFDLLGVPPLLGRTFAQSEDRPGAALTAVLSHELWQGRFGGNLQIIGTTIRANSETAVVIGVMPKGLRFPFNEDVWLPLRLDPTQLRESASTVSVVARLDEGASLEAALGELSALGQRIATEYPDTNEGQSLAAQTYEERFLPRPIEMMLWAMLTAVFGVLLIACVNVANLLLARATLRTREMAVRTAIGASRWRVTRQLLAETGVLAFVGSALGLGLAYLGVELFNRALVDIEKPFWYDTHVDVPTLAFTLTLTAVVALIAGITPARRAAAVDVGEVLKDETRGSSSSRTRRFSSILVTVELAVSCALLVGAGLMIKSVANLRTIDLGFETEGVMTGRVDLFEGEYPTQEDRVGFFRQLEAGLGSIPGVQGASLVSSLPGTGAARWRFAVEGEAYTVAAEYPQARATVITADFFDVMGARWIGGRRFRPADSDSGADPVMIVNESFALRHFPDSDAIGNRVRRVLGEAADPWMRIVGVVGDMHVGGGVGGIGNDEVSPEHMYVPLGLFDSRSLSFAVGTRGAPAELSGPIRRAVSALDANLPAYQLRTMDEVIQQNTWAFGLFGTLFSLFGVVALFLAAVGLYGVMAFSVSQRRQEIGIRVALGASPRGIAALVLRAGIIQIGIGLTAGLGLGWLLARPLAVMLYGVDPLDPGVYGAIAITLAVVGLLATLIPASSAARTGFHPGR
jgi:predicted permease